LKLDQLSREEGMKKFFFIVLGIIIVGSGFSQNLIRNSARPLNPQAGRILKLERVLEISDASGEFFFKFPTRFHLDAKGFLYFLDDNQLLKFSPEGKFIRNFYKVGQGPGEIASRYQMVSYLTFGGGLYVYDGVAKIIHLDEDGKLLGEVRQTAGRFFSVLGMSEDGYFMTGQTSAPRDAPAGFQEVESQVHLVSLDGTTAEKILGFTSRTYQGLKFWLDWDRYSEIFNQADGSLYVTHTCEYKVVRADLVKRTIVASFTREYPRVKFSVPDSMKDFYEKYNPPKKDWENDISAMFVCDNNLWVKTSTSTKNKGNLFDVFDPQGRFLDSFYLNVDRTLALARANFIYVIEKDKEENFLIRKYKVVDGPKSLSRP
jgi:hypothetical protein